MTDIPSDLADIQQKVNALGATAQMWLSLFDLVTGYLTEGLCAAPR